MVGPLARDIQSERKTELHADVHLYDRVADIGSGFLLDDIAWMILPVWYLCFDDNVDLIQLGITQGEVSAPAAVMLYDPR